MAGDDSGTSRGVWPGAAVVAVIVVISGVILLGPAPHTGTPTIQSTGTSAYVLPRSAFNITDHNLTYSSNGFLFPSVVLGSYEVTIENRLVGSGQLPDQLTEAQIGIGPIPAGSDESNITPLLIIQEASTGLLRIEYIPFPMNDTYGYLVYDGVVAAAGPAPFSGHLLKLRYVETSAPVPPYVPSRPYGQTTGNLTVTWDGTTLASSFPLAWSSFGGFYAYGLETDAFRSGAVFANVTTLIGPTGFEQPSPLRVPGLTDSGPAICASPTLALSVPP